MYTCVIIESEWHRSTQVTVVCRTIVVGDVVARRERRDACRCVHLIFSPVYVPIAMATDVPFVRIREALCRSGFGGVSLSPGAFPALYGYAVSGSVPVEAESGPPDWAVLSYVQTNSPMGVGGVPQYVANEVEDVLDALLETGVLRHRALWMDVASIGQPGFAAAGVLQCISAPLIVVPPSRTKEYARYQVPDRWDESTYHSFVVLEDMMRNCPVCRRFCPEEWDGRLLNIAAALRAWPIIETILGSVARGAFISFESFDRYAYTVEWMQVLLHLALETGEYAPGLIEKSIELYGQPLFRPCVRCVTNGKEVLNRHCVSPNLKMLEGLFLLLYPIVPNILPSANNLLFDDCA